LTGWTARAHTDFGNAFSITEIVMKTKTWMQLLSGIAVFAGGVATGLVAQTLTDSPQRIEQKRADLSGAPGMEVIISTGEYKTGETIDLHIHHGIEAAYVVQGASVQSPGKDPMPLPTGASLLNMRDVKHGGFKVVSDTPLKLFTVHIVDKGKPLYDYGK
jgi:quercetin dioxygenase-like cupin family protein